MNEKIKAKGTNIQRELLPCFNGGQISSFRTGNFSEGNRGGKGGWGATQDFRGGTKGTKRGFTIFSTLRGGKKFGGEERSSEIITLTPGQKGKGLYHGALVWAVLQV